KISIVSVFTAELFGGDRAQVVELFDQPQRIESLHPRRQRVIQVIPSPGSVGLVHSPALAAERAEISPHAIGPPPTAPAASIHLPINLLAPVPQSVRLEEVYQRVRRDIDLLAEIRNACFRGGIIDHAVTADESIFPFEVRPAIAIVRRFSVRPR